MSRVKDIIDAALKLAPAERAQIVRELIVSLEAVDIETGGFPVFQVARQARLLTPDMVRDALEG